MRREILTAYDSGALVVPVLKGRKTFDRLHVRDLPAELAWLAEVQSLLLDVHESSGDLHKIGDFVAVQVPRLRTIDHTADTSAAPTNSAGGSQGPLFQTGTVSGNVNVFSSTHGPVHTGKGDIYQDPRLRREEADQ